VNSPDDFEIASNENQPKRMISNIDDDSDMRAEDDEIEGVFMDDTENEEVVHKDEELVEIPIPMPKPKTTTIGARGTARRGSITFGTNTTAYLQKPDY
jgi:hypothetical protein